MLTNIIRSVLSRLPCISKLLFLFYKYSRDTPTEPSYLSTGEFSTVFKLACAGQF